MIRKTAFLLLLLFTCSLYAQEKKVRIAVMPFKNVTGDKKYDWLCDGFSESLSTALAQIPRFVVIERSQIDKVVDELGFQSSDLVDEKKAVKVGKLLGVEKLVVGSFQIFQGSINLNSRIVNVESGEIDKDGIISNKRDQLDNIFQLQEAISLMLVKAFGQTISKKEEEKISTVTQSKGSLSAYEYYMKGWNAYNDKDYDTALENYQKAVDVNPKYVDAHNNIGLVYYAREDYENARINFQKAVDFDPDYAIGHYNLGLVHYQLKNYPLSIRHYQKSIDLRPNYVYAYYGLGLTYYAMQNYDKSMEYYEKTIDLDPRYDNVYYAIGLVYNARKNYDEALRYYEKCLEINPKYANAYFAIGLVYYYLADYSLSIENYKKSIELNPNFDSNYYNIGLSYYAIQDHMTAIFNYQKALQLNPQNANAYHALGLAANAAGNRELAIQAYEEFIRRFPTHYNIETVKKLLAQVKAQNQGARSR